MQTILDILKSAGGWHPGLSLKIENQPYMSLVIEAMDESGPCGLPALSVAHYGEQNGDPYTFTDDLAVDINGDDENDQRSAEEVLLSTTDNTDDDKLTRFALRLALSGHVGIPRENEFDFLTEAENVFAPPQPKKKATGNKAKKPTPIKANAPASKPKMTTTARSRSQPSPRAGASLAQPARVSRS